jgi:polyisoprenoid-binding protein YceI
VVNKLFILKFKTMKKITIALGLAFALFSFKSSETTTWGVDGVHSHVGFSVNHLGINDIIGNFTTYESKITTSKEDFSDAQFEFSADVASVNTGNTMRDEHLKKEDMFDAAKFPKFTFKSTSISKIKENTYKLVGDLSLKGITKKVELTAKYNGSLLHPMYKKTFAGFHITGTVKRSDFGIAKEMPAPMLSDEVAINVDTEFSKN